MIDLENQKLKVPGKPEEDIEKWVVVFVSIKGVHETLEEALSIGGPVIPMPAAMGENVFELSLIGGMPYDGESETIEKES